MNEHNIQGGPKTGTHTFVSNFANPIFIILSPAESLVNFQYWHIDKIMQHRLSNVIV